MSDYMDEQRKKTNSPGWKIRFPWIFETRTEHESEDDSESLKLRGKNPLQEEESNTFEDPLGD